MFVIVRHGNTFAAGETPRRIGARTDLPLTATGSAQAHALGRNFAMQGMTFDRVLVSPLMRTRQTAEAILEHQDHPPAIEICDWLREIDHGPDEDQPDETIIARIGADALAAWDAQAMPPPGWIVDGDTRRDAWRRLFRSASNATTLLVTSNGAARFALMAEPALLDSLPPRSGLKLPTGGYGIIGHGASGTLELLAWGQRP